MSYLINNQQKINDIIFKQRNKNYGAYVLRSDYGFTVLKSISIMLFGTSAITIAAYLYMNHQNLLMPDHFGQVVNDKEIYVVKFNAEPEVTQKETKKVEPAKSSPQNQKNNTQALVIQDSVAVNTFTQSLQINQNITTLLNQTSISETGSGTSTTQAEDNNNNTKNDFASAIKNAYEVDSPPEFEGGINALRRFISQNLKYPEMAIIEDQGGTVFVNFVVDENGEVGQLKLLNKKGFGMDEEALRVVSMIPKFKSPAKIKGKAVKINYQLPIKFALK